ncbi:uncharacterized protein LOC121388010 isoform X7 [Gigantopelta aegis]|uniref:uncharacterized protein LOC121388010 isoform X7 n=1 Tax=Gigantopelta aegis TaxID=1735272 RepID=UPI001B88BF54|nr:uncharacterized protein LOC121388010 isoform X7 [Gigantopelta aegis]
MKLNPVWSKYDYIRGQKSIKNIAIEKILEDIRTERDIKSTRAHSALRGSVFGAPSRRSLSTNDYYVQRPLHSAYDTRSEEYAIGDSVLRATYLSDAVLDDTYDTSLKSRGRDQRLLSDATSAIPPSVLEPVKPSRARIGYKPLSRRSRNYPIFEKAMDRSPIPLSTSTLTASPRPFPSLPGSLLKYSSRYRGVTSLPTGVRRFTGVHVRPPMFEYEPDEKPTASMPPSPRLLGGYVSPRIVSRRYKSVLKSGQITPPYPYSTGSQRSTQLLGGYVSPKMVSAQHDIARARGALSSLLRSYDDASLLMSVEGDAMSRHHDGKVGFRYYHPPVSIKGSGVESRHLRLSSFIEGQDDFLGDYVTKMRAIQNDVRKNLLRDSSTRDFDISPYSYEQRLRFMPLRIGSTKHVVPVTTFRKRLAGGLRHRLDVFHLPLVETVLPESPQQLMLSSTRGGNASLSPLKLSVLDKIKIKAALVASKVEVEPQRRRRKPHSQYAANKLRETRRQGDQDSYVPTISTTTMHASRPPLGKKGLTVRAPMPSDRKAIRDVDGFTKPRNVLSWQYRLESRVNPTEVMYRPGVYNRMREQVRDAHEKLDRHRQLLDRYMNETGEAGFHRYQRAAEMDESSQSRGRSSSAPPAPSQPVMSELRRRLRKTICKSKRDPNYYRE